MLSGSLKNSMAAPFKCPLSTCEETISASMLLSHFMKIHHHDENVDLKEVQEKEKISLLVAVTDKYLELDQNVCLGILMYNMNSTKHSNVLLSKQHEYYEHHVPILIMACRGNYVKIYDNDADFIDPEADFLALWLLMPEQFNNMKLFATMSAHNEELTKSLSSLIQVRKVKDSQEVREFMEAESDFLTINAGFLKQISTDGSIFVEISIAENLL
jgi:hypothetical protein